MTDFEHPFSNKILIGKLKTLLESYPNKEKIEKISFQACDFSEENSLEQIAEIVKLFPNCQKLDLSFNRYQPHCWKSILLLLNYAIDKKNICLIIDIRFTPLASIDSKHILSKLNEDQIKNLIWIPKKWLTGMNWLACLELEKIENIEKIDDKKYELANLTKKIHEQYYETHLEYD